MSAYPLLLALLLDEDLRERFLSDRESVLAHHHLTGEAADAFRALDGTGLCLEAQARQRYLMGDLCRSHPLSSAVIGTCPGGRRALLAFLRSPALHRPLAARNAALGDFLGTLLPEILQATWGDAGPAFFGPFLAMEQGLAASAQALRTALQAGVRLPPRTPPALDRPLAIPPFFAAFPLPCSRGLLRVALGACRPEEVWRWIEHREFSPDRLLTLLRGQHEPLLLVTRAIPADAQGLQTGSLALELAGISLDDLHAMQGVRLVHLPPHLLPIARTLLDQGLLISQPPT